MTKKVTTRRGGAVVARRSHTPKVAGSTPATAPIPQPTVAELLAQSRQKHQEYRDNLPRMGPGNPRAVKIEGNIIAAAAAMWRACRLRVEAHALDPEQKDPAWQDEAVTHDHDALLGFYGQQISR